MIILLTQPATFGFFLGFIGRLHQRYMSGERKDCTPIAQALHSCMFWLQRKDVQELVGKRGFTLQIC